MENPGKNYKKSSYFADKSLQNRIMMTENVSPYLQITWIAILINDY